MSVKKSTPPSSETVNRRNFLKTAGLAAAAVTIVPRHVLGGKGFLAPSDMLNVAGIGAGGKGESDIANFAKSGKANIAFLCDVDDRRAAKTVTNFPKAKYHIYEKEWNYWHSTKSDMQVPLFKFFVEKNITPLTKYDLNLYKGDFVDIVSGIKAVKATGHTPGQIALIIDNPSSPLLYISDAFLHPLHIERLDWQTNYDTDHKTAKRSRTKLLDLAHKQNMLVNGFHFDFPGLGRVEKSKNKWVWKYTDK